MYLPLPLHTITIGRHLACTSIFFSLVPPKYSRLYLHFLSLLTHLLTYLLTSLLPYFLTYLLTYFLTYLLTSFLTYLLTDLLTY